MLPSHKAVSAIIATVILVAFVIAVAALVTGSFTNLIKSQTSTIDISGKGCTGAALFITASAASASSIQIAVENEGQNALSNFTVTAKKADGLLYTNTSAAASLSIAKGSSAIITLNDINSTAGCPLSLLRVSAGNCPVSMEIDNSSKSIC